MSLPVSMMSNDILLLIKKDISFTFFYPIKCRKEGIFPLKDITQRFLVLSQKNFLTQKRE